MRFLKMFYSLHQIYAEIVFIVVFLNDGQASCWKVCMNKAFCINLLL